MLSSWIMDDTTVTTHSWSGSRSAPRRAHMYIFLMSSDNCWQLQRRKHSAYCMASENSSSVPASDSCICSSQTSWLRCSTFPFKPSLDFKQWMYFLGWSIYDLMPWGIKWHFRACFNFCIHFIEKCQLALFLGLHYSKDLLETLLDWTVLYCHPECWASCTCETPVLHVVVSGGSSIRRTKCWVKTWEEMTCAFNVLVL